jgi:hypothetical protein
MSLTTIDPSTYNSLLSKTIARYISAGFPRSEAIKRAHEIMRSAFICSEAEAQTDLQKDLDDDRLNLGR